MNSHFQTIKMFLETLEDTPIFPDHIAARTIINLCDKVLMEGLTTTPEAGEKEAQNGEKL